MEGGIGASELLTEPGELFDRLVGRHLGRVVVTIRAERARHDEQALGLVFGVDREDREEPFGTRATTVAHLDSSPDLDGPGEPFGREVGHELTSPVVETESFVLLIRTEVTTGPPAETRIATQVAGSTGVSCHSGSCPRQFGSSAVCTQAASMNFNTDPPHTDQIVGHKNLASFERAV